VGRHRPGRRRAAAVDRTPRRARGGEWHRNHRRAGVVPHTSIDTEAGWTKRGGHGWGYGWKLPLVVTVAAVWIPLAAALTPANGADNVLAPAVLPHLPPALRWLLADVADDDPALRVACAAADLTLVTPRRGASPHTDAGTEVRRVFHHLRSHAIENWNGQFKGLFDCADRVPTRGLIATRRFLLGAVLVSQLVLLHRLALGAALRVGLKPCLRAA